jgi:WD40 repeat protein
LLSAADGLTLVGSIAFVSHGDLHFSGDGRYLAHASLDLTTVQVWDLKSPSLVGRTIRPPMTHNLRNCLSVEFSDDGKFLVTARDTDSFVWDTASGAQLTPPISVPHPMSLAFDSSARRLLVAGTDRTIRVIDLSPTTRPLGDLYDRARLLANRTLDSSGRLVPLAAAERAALWERYKATAP